MNRNIFRKKLLVTAVALGMGMACGLVNAAEFHLCAGATTNTMPDGTVVDMWGYALDDDLDFANGCGAAPIQSPGPILTVAHDDPDPNVTIHLTNNLSVDTSLMVPGQSGAMTPVFTTDAQGRQRVTSLTKVTAPGATDSYTWANFQPGSFVYQSGTHMAVQVQMGLYGGMKKDAALGSAYTGVPYDQEAIVFYSEIDPALHLAVANGSYGSADPANPGPTSTLNYHPKYFLVNGAATGSTALAAAGAGQRTLLRFFNMGLRTVAPSVLGEHVKVVAEDGRPYPYPREQYSLMMAAGKTHDAIFTAAQEGSYPVYDRLLNLSSGAMAPGGLYAFLSVGAAAAGTPMATADAYSTSEDTALTVDAVNGVLANDTDPEAAALTASLVTGVAQGDLILNSDGSFTYTPPTNFSGITTFTYSASDGVLTSVPATVTLTVTSANDVPLAVNDSYAGVMDTPLTVAAPGVLGNDTDADGDALSAALVTGAVNGTLILGADGSISYTPNVGFSGSDTFTYVASDGAGNSNEATVTLNIAAPVNQPPVANDDSATMPMNTALTLDLLANDNDPEGMLDPTSVVISGTLKKFNQLVNNGDGTVTFTPRTNFRGSESFTYTVRDAQGAISNSATVRINVVR
ncbi:MAG TPA: Ig-like domain-containing protein [Gammaproteobacteria bacterium]